MHSQIFFPDLLENVEPDTANPENTPLKIIGESTDWRRIKLNNFNNVRKSWRLKESRSFIQTNIYGFRPS